VLLVALAAAFVDRDFEAATPDVDLPVVLLFSQLTRPVGAGFVRFCAGCSAIALPAQMTPIISATILLRSIRAPPWNPRIVRCSASAAGPSEPGPAGCSEDE
jgi:hypothetical protein